MEENNQEKKDNEFKNVSNTTKQEYRVFDSTKFLQNFSRLFVQITSRFTFPSGFDRIFLEKTRSIDYERAQYWQNDCVFA